MSFRVWFRGWIMAFFRLLAFDYKKPKSEYQRKRERERRLRAKHSSANLYRTKKSRKKRRSSMAVQNERLISALFGFVGVSLGILLLPFGLLDWGRKSARAKKASRGNSKAKKKPSAPKTSATQSKKAAAKTAQKKTTAQALCVTPKAPPTHTTDKPTSSTTVAPICLLEHHSAKAVSSVAETPSAPDPDESTPRSTPKNEKDQYIRKRMLIAGSYYCDKAVLDTLEVGAYIDMEAEPDNPYDTDAVKLLFNGQKIGYVAKKDHTAFATCLKLKRKIYGVITAIIEENGQTKYEFEAWFDSGKRTVGGG